MTTIGQEVSDSIKDSASFVQGQLGKAGDNAQVGVQNAADNVQEQLDDLGSESPEPEMPKVMAQQPIPTPQAIAPNPKLQPFPIVQASPFPIAPQVPAVQAVPQQRRLQA